MAGIGVASVEFDVVDLPFGHRLGVQFHVVEDARIAGARVVAVVLVDAEAQSARVHLPNQEKNQRGVPQRSFHDSSASTTTHVIGEGADSAGEARRIGSQSAVRAALLVQPTVVQADQLISSLQVP